MIRRPPRSTLFPTRRSSDLAGHALRLQAPEPVVGRPPGEGGLDERGQHVAVRDAVAVGPEDRKSTRLNSSHITISYAVFCLKKKKTTTNPPTLNNTQEEANQ